MGQEAAGLVVRFVAETMDRAARRLADGTIYLVTGDIPAMWLRDSATQVLPLLRLGAYCPAAEQFVADVLRRQLSFISARSVRQRVQLRTDRRRDTSVTRRR